MSAESILAVDLNSQAILYKKNDSVRRSVASLTKLMTAYVVLKENDTNSIADISTNAAAASGSTMGLSAGEQITIEDLLHGLLIDSGNDAATALAEFNAGDEQSFINKMNAEAKSLGMGNTAYANTTGLDSDNAYSTAQDLIILSTHLLKNKSIREIVSQSTAERVSLSGQVHKLVNTNILLGELGIKGLKTGTTAAAGECLIALAESPDGHEILTIVLNSKNRFVDTKILIDWIYKSFTW
jgi:D-alanyl-D-alanine carboxypeptidase (penicillin-binding protein 5/6)